MTGTVLTADAVTAVARPAGPAPLDQVVLATATAAVLSAALGGLLLAHRTGRLTVLDRVTSRLERVHGGTAGWASLPLYCAMASLVTALFGMYWDIALHIGVGRDEGPLANPAHYPIFLGLFGVSASGALACALPRGRVAGTAAVRISSSWHAPVGGVLLTAAGAYALLGFPLDDVWHRIFGQDVTLWGPTHLMLIGGAGLSLVAMAILWQEGRLAVGSQPRPVQRFLQRTGIMGGLLIGLSVFQAEFDFGVPQFRLVLQPLLVAAAAGMALVAARLWIGRGGALAAVAFYLLVRGGVSVLVGPLVIGELWAAVPLYLGEALCVEAAALVLARRPLTLGAVGGLLVGTAGLATEYAWTQLVFVLPWTPDILVEGVAMAVAGGVAGGLLGALLVLGLQRELPAPVVSRAVFAVAVGALAAAAANGLATTRPAGLEATLRVGEVSQGRADVEVVFNRTPVDGAPAWLTVTGWQGGSPRGLHVDHLEKVGGTAGATTYRTTQPLPVTGSWKTMVRLHDGRAIAAMPLYLPADEAIDKAEVPAASGAIRAFDDEHLLLQRERKPGVPAELWLVGGLIVAACSATLVVALGWGVSRFARRRGDEPPVTTPDPELEDAPV